MKRIQEKVKDIVNVRKFESLKDFASDPGATLSAYHFTDATSELMSKWLDRVSGGPDGAGSALALAGYRGVGKSHFLAAFGTIASFPDLRGTIADGHVSSAAQSLLRRKYPVAFVRRGSRPSLIDELRDAVASALDVPAEGLGPDISSILDSARERTGDVPLLVLIDTAFERPERVTRDDGALLGEIALNAKRLKYFVGVALDDDIAGADGSNSAIVQTFSIDYLDQEHLYKVVDTYVFPKGPQMRGVLHDVYEYFREVIPSFRWSEQKFSTLYPLHPAILEVAPFVRLYIHDFALLGFAADAGERILGRPANSLIALDEVFDSSEKDLRKIDDLHEAFEAFDRLNSEVVGKIPVMQRLQAKLILKALLLLSLEGQGTTVGEICSGMLIFDESDPQKAQKTVEELLRMFATALPDAIVVTDDEGREVRYGFRASGKDTLNRALDLAALDVDASVVNDLLQRHFHERFSDSTFFSIDGSRKRSMPCSLTWRGGIHRGRVNWGDPDTESINADEQDPFLYDWDVRIDLAGKKAEIGGGTNERQTVIWLPAELSRKEVDTILRFHVLTANSDFRETYGDELRGPLHSHTVALDRIFNRVFLEDARLVVDGFDYNLTDEARMSATLGGIFSLMLEPLFEARYPEHPHFIEKLGVGEVATLVADLYSGSRHQMADVQQLAQTFALPLGLVKLVEGAYVPASEEELRAAEHVRSVLSIVDRATENGAPLKQIYSKLKEPPYGLVREAQQLILSAMVAQRLVEFVTSKGDRINQRSLDLKIIWDDVVGVALPLETAYEKKRLQKWAAVFAAGSEFRSFDSESDTNALIHGLQEWVETWESAGVLKQFNAIPTEFLNTKLWRLASRVSNALGAAVQSIGKFKEGKSTLEDCIGRISEVFLDDLGNLEKAAVNLSRLENFVKYFHLSRKIRVYLAMAEPTVDEGIEETRRLVLEKISEFERDPDESSGREIGYAWTKFEREFTEAFLLKHDSIMRSPENKERVSELRNGDDWRTFESFSPFALIPEEIVRSIHNKYRRLTVMHCTADTVTLLKSRPFCSCEFTLLGASKYSILVEEIQEALSTASVMIHAGIAERSDEILDSFSATDLGYEGDDKAKLQELETALKNRDLPKKLTEGHRRILLTALSRIENVPDLNTGAHPESEPVYTATIVQENAAPVN